MTFEELGMRTAAALAKIANGAPVDTFKIKSGDKSVFFIAVSEKHEPLLRQAVADIDSFNKSEIERGKQELMEAWDRKLNGSDH